MKKFINIILLITFQSCIYNYHLIRKEPISQQRKILDYEVKVLEKPNLSSPYLSLRIKVRYRIQKLFREKYEGRVNPYPSLIPALAGIPVSFLLFSSGYQVLGRNLIALSLLSSGGMFYFYKKARPKIKYEKKTIYFEETVPVKNKSFTLLLKEKKYSLSYTTDAEGKLTVNIADFAPFYEKGKDFEFVLLSPEGKKITTLFVSTAPVSRYLLKKKQKKFPPDLYISVIFSDDEGNKNRILDAYETAEIKVLIENKGMGTANDLDVYLKPLTPVEHIHFEGLKKVSEVKPGDTAEVVFKIYGDSLLDTKTVKFRIEVLEPYFGADAEPKILMFKTREFLPPELVLYDKGVEEGWIEPRKTAHLSLILQNRGTGKAEDVKVRFKFPLNLTYLGDEEVINIGDMEPGEWRRIDFPLYISPRYKADSLKFVMIVEEKRKKFGKEINISFPIKKKITKPAEIAIAPLEERKKSFLPPPEVAVDVDMEIPYTGIENPDAIGVVIGIKDYANPDVPSVDYAINDARIIKEYLINVLGFKEENIIYLENPSKADLEKVFGTKGNPQGKLYNWVKTGVSDVFIFYSGHGAPDIKSKTGYFVPYDGDPEYIEVTGYSLKTFYENLKKVPARKKIVVIDACFSGRTEKGMLLKGISPLLLGIIKKADIDTNTVVFTAAKGSQVSGWYPEKRHGIFTYYFLKGLKGEADKNKDGVLTAGEMRDYLTENVKYTARRLKGIEQEPDFIGKKEIVIYKKPEAGR